MSSAAEALIAALHALARASRTLDDVYRKTLLTKLGFTRQSHAHGHTRAIPRPHPRPQTQTGTPPTPAARLGDPPVWNPPSPRTGHGSGSKRKAEAAAEAEGTGAGMEIPDRVTLVFALLTGINFGNLMWTFHSATKPKSLELKQARDRARRLKQKERDAQVKAGEILPGGY